MEVRMRKWVAAGSLALVAAANVIFASLPAQADDGRVDLVLVLAADVSRSVDDRKFKLQREGYAAAIVDPRVLKAIAGGANGRIAIVFVEWASEFEQRVIVDWTIIANERDAQDLSARILAAARPFWGRTSISAAIEYSVGLLVRCPFQGDRLVIDISGDGTNNSGRDVAGARDAAVELGVTINGLAILSETPLLTNPTHTHPPGGLTSYYEKQVIGGPGAFVVEAEGFEAFRQSLINKLVKEIASSEPLRPAQVAETGLALE
jgi:hypothetical protein